MIRDVASGTTGGIGPVRYVEDGVTVNIPITYVVEGGKTVLVYKEKEKVPTGDVYYLYNRGSMSDVLGGFTVEGSSHITITEESDHLAIRCPAGATMDGEIKSGLMDLSSYSTIYMEYEYVNGTTGEFIESASSRFTMICVDTEGNTSEVGIYPGFTSEVCKTVGEGFLQCIRLVPTYSSALSDEYDVILKIYSIRVEK